MSIFELRHEDIQPQKFFVFFRLSNATVRDENSFIGPEKQVRKRKKQKIFEIEYLHVAIQM
jgi:hypothetical protein